MESVKFDRERGQILVQVAIMVGVLFAFVALAVDAGNVYGGRRRMQNAADAGALAGARAICFPEGIDPETAAHDYAERNGARREDVEVTIEDYTVIVTAAQTLDTFFAGVIGINEADVRAEAAAACGGTVSAAGLWPLAFNFNVYTDRIPCGETFLVFSDNDANPDTGPNLECAHEDCYNDNGTEREQDDFNDSLDVTYEDCEDTYNCQEIGFHFATDERGWLLFPEVDDYPCNNYNCGADGVGCYIEHDYDGIIEQYDCVPGQPGVVASMQNPVGTREGDVVHIILWEQPEEPCEPDDVIGTCHGDPYYVKDFGCVKIIQWVQSYRLSAWQGTTNPKILKVIEAQKICKEDEAGNPMADYNECSSATGSTSGVPPEEWEDKSVSLIQWPRP